MAVRAMTETELKEDLKLRIEVIDTPRGKRFLYNTQLGWNELTAKTLHIPCLCCGETIELWRNGKKVDEGSIRWVGSHAAMPQIVGLKKFQPYTQRLEADGDFEVDDEIVITYGHMLLPEKDQPSGWFPDAYWAQMTMNNLEINEAYIDSKNP